MEIEDIIKRNRELLIGIARKTINSYVKEGKKECPDSYPEELNFNAGVFVTINENNELRGCIGVPYPEMKLIDALCEAAVSATQDPRFLPIKEKELKNIKIEISILTPPEKIEANDPMDYINEIKPGIDGLIIEKGGASGLFLPQVWKEIPDKREFLNELCLKAGLPKNTWENEKINLYRFHAYIINEEDLN